MKYGFENNHKQQTILKQRLLWFRDKEAIDREYGIGSLLQEAGLAHDQRSSVNKYLSEKQKTLSDAISELLWVHFVEKRSNEILNENIAYDSAIDANFGNKLMSFLNVDRKKNAEIFKALCGEYVLLREPWFDQIPNTPPNKIVVGRLYIDQNPDCTLGVYLETNTITKAGVKSRSVFEGYCYYHRYKIVFCCSNPNGDLTIMNFHKHMPFEPSLDKIEMIFGNLFTLIDGDRNHRTFRIAAEKTHKANNIEFDLLDVDDIILDKYAKLRDYIVHGTFEI